MVMTPRALRRWAPSLDRRNADGRADSMWRSENFEVEILGPMAHEPWRRQDSDRSLR